ncbi:CHASE2 domain-containing protein [Phormidium sp. CLA17]|uniref:CHASE2 domain-containing protein n=1 Tax=Leptolyngbya sp. Cla-17 TaxID=2803751 RepID=UPI00149271D2|nr:CHASE2 domain-containing protein [Leptolyngbya sp. Cla-17]MBM0744252.1 CHASE2 domain-containing protein [Leptolyngbya sp. Cla-17]
MKFPIRCIQNNFWRLLPGSAIAFGSAIFLQIGFFAPLEQIAYTALFNLRGKLPWDDRLVMVTIDETSLQQIGRFPWSRKNYIKLLDILNRADASIIAMDLLFSEPSSDDAALASAMMQSGRVVLPLASSKAEFLQPVPQLRDVAIATGHILHSTDTDGVTRSFPLINQDAPAFGLAVVQSYALIHEAIPLPNLTQSLWINWAGSVQHIPQYSFNDVVQGQVELQTFRNKIVLVGVTASGFDPLITPYDRNPPASGMHLHAAIINNLLQQNALQVLHPHWLPMIFLVAGPGLSWLFSSQSKKKWILLWLLLGIGWGTFSLRMFQAALWVPVVMPVTVMTLTALATSLTERLRSDALLRGQVQHLWKTYRQDIVHSSQATQSLLPTSDRTWSYSDSVGQLAALAEQFGRSQSTQAAIAKSLSVGLAAADTNGQVWFCNPVASQWLQIGVGDHLSANLVPDWFSQSELDAEFQHLQHQKIMSSPKVLCRGDRWFELKLEPLLPYATSGSDQFSHSHLDGFLVLLSDITTQKQAEETLAQQVQELHRLDQLKDDFLSTVSHELRSPMTNIKMASELLKIAKSQESSAHYLDILQTECKREIDLINDLLDLQRVEAGSQNFSPEAIILEHWLPPVIEPFYQRAETHHQTLEIEIAPQLPTLMSDQPSLERVLVELVNNACKYTPSGGHIQVTADSTISHLQLAICNSGAEIPETELPRIFEKFYRVPHADPWKRGGTGLGLALVKQLVESLGGSIHVVSGLGQTTFTVRFPLNTDA